MIPEYYIHAWAVNAPWPRNELIEQDMIICRALIAIFSDEFLTKNLAFRGGTALHKLYLSPQPRYSEDIDLVQIHEGPIKPIIDHLRDALLFLGEPKTKRNAHNNTLIYRLESEILPVMPIRLKVEINCREHFNRLGWVHCPFAMQNEWYSGECLITTYELDELLGTKLRALYQRKKGRDLFDLYRAVNASACDTERIISCFRTYMEFVVEKAPTRKEFLLNLEQKMTDSVFLGDTTAILRPGINYVPEKAFETVVEKLISKID